jgi:hypothetical protein
MFLPQLVQHICGIKAGVVTQLPWDDLQRFGIAVDEQLSLAWYAAGMISQGPGHLQQREQP